MDEFNKQPGQASYGQSTGSGGTGTAARMNEQISDTAADVKEKVTDFGGTRQTVEALAGALVGVAMNRVSRYIDSLLPGFEREFSHAQAAKSPYSYRQDSPKSEAPPKSTVAGAD